MKIAIIGAGFTGLTAAYKLSKKGFKVVVFEKESLVGGLAGGFRPALTCIRRGREGKWQWSLEDFYHHLFVSDKKILKLAKEIDIPVVFKRPKTSVLIDGQIFQLDSPLNLLRFSKLSFFSRLRMGLILFFLKINPFWKPLEKITNAKWLPRLMGKKAYKMIWEPLLVSKFGNYSKNVPLSWFWARIKKRSVKLGYPEGGFQVLIDKLVKIIKENGGEIYLNKELACFNDLNHSNKFDRIIFTTPVKKLKMLGALNLILVLKEKFLTDDTYWLNICDKDYPFLSVVEHTNFMDKKYYNNDSLVYVGGYYPQDHRYFKMKKEDILKEFLPYLKKINPNFKILNLKSYILNLNKFAQPVISLNYSKIMPPFKTPVKNVYLANMQQVYPWDRGTNYAVKLGEKVARLMT